MPYSAENTVVQGLFGGGIKRGVAFCSSAPLELCVAASSERSSQGHPTGVSTMGFLRRQKLLLSLSILFVQVAGSQGKVTNIWVTVI